MCICFDIDFEKHLLLEPGSIRSSCLKSKAIGSPVRVQTDPLDQLPYFVSWGGEAAVSLADRAFHEFLGEDLAGQRVLEIGAGRGKMSVLFGLLGAEQVVAIDMEPDFPRMAIAEAEKWGVLERMDFQCGADAVASQPDGFFDLIFAKSVLLYIDDLETYLRGVAPKLRPGGRICFLENLSRNPLDHLARNLIHLWRGGRNYHYMDRARIAAIGRVFELQMVEVAMNPLLGERTPGWYLICGRNPIK